MRRMLWVTVTILIVTVVSVVWWAMTDREDPSSCQGSGLCIFPHARLRMRTRETARDTSLSVQPIPLRSVPL